eukprot:TRINITY_DN25894_c0_g1_i1.p1 TRINITY_DN25894_c0_g1~~TRINITY_DN25894_c0_g1_i1.p1  ORF type:complete len:735 (+),score=113.99 TRINITY_DN25894_c0_g1_i1:15-2219(+)
MSLAPSPSLTSPTMRKRSEGIFSQGSVSGSYKLLPSQEPPQDLLYGGFVGESLAGSLQQELQDDDSSSANWTSSDFLESVPVQALTVALILVNAVVIGFETDWPDAFPWGSVENIFLLFFTMELGLRMHAAGLAGYFRFQQNPDISWNVFDFLIVSFGIVSWLVSILAGEHHALTQNAMLFRMLRLLRILRVLRIIRIVRFLKQLYLLAYGFVEGTMAVVWVTILASFMLYICAVILVRAYGHIPEDDPDHEFFEQKFGTIPKTMFALFELISAPDLQPYRAVMFQNPPLVCFLVIFIILGSFGINGLLVALINESILEKNQARIEAERMERETKRKAMQQRCREIFDTLDVNKNRVLPRDELMKCTSQIANLFEALGVNFQRHDLDQMFYIMDYNDTGIIERSEFVQGVVELCDQIRPMSIMELHYQVSKCASKVENCDIKVDSLSKALETCDMKVDNVVEGVRCVAGTLDPDGEMHKKLSPASSPILHRFSIDIDRRSHSPSSPLTNMDSSLRSAGIRHGETRSKGRSALRMGSHSLEHAQKKHTTVEEPEKGNAPEASDGVVVSTESKASNAMPPQPTSLSSLQSQLTQCASSIEDCYGKMHTISAALPRWSTDIDAVVNILGSIRLGSSEDPHRTVRCEENEQTGGVLAPQPATTLVPAALTLPEEGVTPHHALREALQGHCRLLASAQASIAEAANAEGMTDTRASIEVLLRLQRANADVLEALFKSQT